MLQRITKAALISIVIATSLVVIGLVGGIERDQLDFAGFGIGVAICAVTICGCCLLYWVLFEHKKMPCGVRGSTKAQQKINRDKYIR